MSKLTRKLQVLLSDDEVNIINRIILNDAILAEERPIAISAFIRNLIRDEILKRTDEEKSWDKSKVKQLKSK